MKPRPNRSSASVDLARRNRRHTAAIVLGYGLAMALLCPDPLERAQLHYRIVIPIGYGHLLAAALGSRRRRVVPDSPRDARLRALARLLTALAIGAGLYGHRIAVQLAPTVVWAALALATWHAMENDRALGLAYQDGLRVPPIDLVGAPARAALLRAGVIFGLVVAFAFGPRGSPGNGTAVPLYFGDLFALSTLYHLVGWLIFTRERVRTRRHGDALARRVLAAHLPGTLLCTASLLGTSLPYPADGLAHAGRRLLFSPELYLFWSLLHVVQTGQRRGFRR